MSNLNPGGLTRVLNYIKTWVTGLLNDKANSSHTHTTSQITDFPTNYVTTDTTQTISGDKTFSKIITVKDNCDTAGKDLLHLIDDTINTSNEDENGFPLTGHTNSLKIRGHGTNMLPLMLTGNVFTSGDTSAELRTYKYKDITSDNCRATFQLRYSYANNAGIVYFSNIGSIVPSKTNTTILGSSALQWNSTYTRHILIDNDINIWSSVINKTSNSGLLALRGGTNYSDGASIGLYGKDYNGSHAGAIELTAYGNSDYTKLYIYPNGTMSVYNNSTDTTKNIAMQEDVDTLLSGKANSSHTHTKSEITDFPTIPTVNNATLTIQKNGTTVKTFTANASSNVTANITVPTAVSELTNDSGFLTVHPTISTSTDTTSTESPTHSGTFTCIDSVTRDSNGHVTTVNTKTVTLPTDTNTDTKVTQAYSTTNNSYPVLSSATAGITSTNSRGATTAIVNNSIYTNPSTGALYATKLYSNGTEVLTSHQSLSNYSTLANTVKSISISGKTITVTPGSGSAYTLTTQDTVYTHPTTAGNKHIPSGGSSGQFLGWDSDGTAKWVNNPNSDTKNTAGSTDTSSKIFLIGATSQAANPQTYSHDTAYVGTDGCLYSGGTKVLTAHQSLSNYSTKANTIRSLSISGRTITYTKDDGTTGTLTTQDTTYSSLPANGGTSTATAYMNQYDTIHYGVNRLQYYNVSTSTTSGAGNIANPTNDWYYHLLMSHGNSAGYYGDIALCFHSNTLAFRRIASGGDNGWCYIVKNGRTIVSGYEVYVG